VGRKLSTPSGIRRRGAAPKSVERPRPLEKKPVTYRLPVRMKERLLQAVVQDGYGLKGKSKWVDEAIEGFLQDGSWRDQVLDVDMVKGNNEKDVVFLSEARKGQLQEAAHQVIAYAAEMRTIGKRLENLDTLVVSRSSVIRAAIIWRMFKLRMPVLKVAGELPL